MFQDGRETPVEAMRELMNAMPEIQIKRLLRLGRVREMLNTRNDRVEKQDHQAVPALKPKLGN